MKMAGIDLGEVEQVMNEAIGFFGGRLNTLELFSGGANRRLGIESLSDARAEADGTEWIFQVMGDHCQYFFPRRDGFLKFLFGFLQDVDVDNGTGDAVRDTIFVQVDSAP
jgi:hypothetical protein